MSSRTQHPWRSALVIAAGVLAAGLTSVPATAARADDRDQQNDRGWQKTKSEREWRRDNGSNTRGNVARDNRQKNGADNRRGDTVNNNAPDTRREVRQDNRPSAARIDRSGNGGRTTVREYRTLPRRDTRGYVLDSRYHHNHYYPPRGYSVTGAPRGALIIRHGGIPYRYYQGSWYRPYGPRFVVVAPPIGLFISTLPPFYSTVWVHGMPYYYADDVYYTWRPERRGYVVTDPPDDVRVDETSSAPVADDLYIYPKNGQSEEKQAEDRYECHSWAAGQTGFDPTQPLGGVSESQSDAKRDDYHRAMTACLEGRGYSVK